MAFQEHHDMGSDVSDFGNNLANLIVALAGMPASLLIGGLGLANRVLAGPPPASGCDPARIEHRCDGTIVRHHYRYCSTPRCYGCGRGCS